MMESSAARKRGVILGSLWGILAQFVIMVISFVTRNIFLRLLTVDTLGYNTLFAEIVGFLSFAEAGIGVSLSLALYQPVADQDYRRTSGIYYLLIDIYRIISIVVFFMGLMIMLFFPYFVKEEIQDINYIRFAFFLFLVNTSISYRFVPFRNFIGIVQRGYVGEIVTMLSNVFAAALKLVLLLATGSYIVYLAAQFASILLCQLFYPYYIKRNYPYLKEHKKHKLSREEKRLLFRNSFKMMWYRFSSTFISYTDNMIISVFLGVTVIGYLSNYKMVVDIIFSFIRKISNPITSALSNFVSEKSPEDSLQMVANMIFFSYFVASFCCVSLIILLPAFINLWLGHEYIISFIPVFVFILSIYISVVFAPIFDIYNISGCYANNNWVPIVEALLNLIVSLLLVNVLGLTGIFIGTCVCYIFSVMIQGKIVFQSYFKSRFLPFWKKCGVYFILVFALSLITYIPANAINFSSAYMDLAWKMLICLIVPNSINALLFHRTREFSYFALFIKNGLLQAKNVF